MPLGVLATSAHAHTFDQAQPPSPDTIVKQFPAVPETTSATTVPAKLAQTDTPVADTAAPEDSTAEVPVPVVDPTATANPALADTGLVSQDILYSGLALLALGAGFVLGVEDKRAVRAAAVDRP